jgi:hypothetical protein
MNPLRIFHLIREWQAKRDERLSNEFEQVVTYARMHGMRIGEVMAVRKFYPGRGTKAWIRWIDTGEGDSVWIEQLRLSAGQILLASGSHGYGYHHNETVFYINNGCRILDRRAFRGWIRHEVRQSRLTPQPAVSDSGSTVLISCGNV